MNCRRLPPRTQAPNSHAADFLLSSCELVLENPEGAALCHLLLDVCAAAPGWHPEGVEQAHAAGVLLRCCGEQPRLAPKVAAAFQLTADAFSAAQQEQLLDAISALLDSSATSASGVAL